MLALLGLPACDPGSMLVTSAGMVTLISTDKTVTDHAISLALERDCSFVRMSRGESFCIADPAPVANGHCYRTLASVTCYRTSDPKVGDDALVADAPAAAPPPAALDLSGVFGETSAQQ